jgi:pyridoxine 5-phosphate synthase
VATDIQKFGAQGITIHVQMSVIRYQDARDLKAIVYTEFNIEKQHNFIDLVLECKPEQVTLVPDAIGAITSSAGWDTVKTLFTEMIQEFQHNGIHPLIL